MPRIDQLTPSTFNQIGVNYPVPVSTPSGSATFKTTPADMITLSKGNSTTGTITLTANNITESHDITITYKGIYNCMFIRSNFNAGLFTQVSWSDVISFYITYPENTFAKLHENTYDCVGYIAGANALWTLSQIENNNSPSLVFTRVLYTPSGGVPLSLRAYICSTANKFNYIGE